MKDLDLVVNITPHALHAGLTMQCLRSGRHVVSEKPFCLTVDEASSIIRAGRRAKRMVSVFHNRRWDGDYLAIRDAVDRGLLGEVYHSESWCGNTAGPDPPGGATRPSPAARCTTGARTSSTGSCGCTASA